MAKTQAAKDRIMRATSLASADRDSVPEEAFPPVAPRLAREFVQSPLHLWWEAASVAWQRLVLSCLLWFRGGWLYRQTLRGPSPTGFSFIPDDRACGARGCGCLHARAVSAREREARRQGRLRLRSARPSAGFAAALMAFDWLRHLEVAGGDLSRQFALKLTQQWLKRYGRFIRSHGGPRSWPNGSSTCSRMGVLHRELRPVWRSKLFVSLRNQAQMLARTMQEAPEGLPRLKSAAAVALAGLCLGDSRNTAAGLKQLALEIAQQVLPDGGHVSRSPDTLLEVFGRARHGAAGARSRQSRRAARGPQRARPHRSDAAILPCRRWRLFVFHGGGESDDAHRRSRARP
jgi:uncharacterized heparinase superfamily protein